MLQKWPLRLVFNTMTFDDYLVKILEMSENCDTIGESRCVYLDIEGNPLPEVVKIGEQLNRIGGFGAMYQVARALQSKCDGVNYDARELEVAWCGIGEWLS